MPTTYAIPNGRTVMDATLYTGTSAIQSINNTDSGTTGFKPDFVWIKARNQAFDHVLTDSVRGTTKYLISNKTDAEGTYASGVTSFNTNGFSLGADTGAFNSSAGTFVGWQWQAGQGTTSNNTSGSITSTVSVNQTAGFSVVKFTCITGASVRTVGHGLGVAPAMYILKCTTAGSDWDSYHVSLGATKEIKLNTTAAAATTSTSWNNTAPDSSVFTIGSQFVPDTNSYVGYCWTPIPGFSAFGSYTGNGSTDGPFVYLGFRPKFILVKLTSGADNWFIVDTSRNPYNVVGEFLAPNTTDAGSNYSGFDLLSNGFKVRNTGAGINASGGSYIYACFAENPFKYANAR